MVLVVVMVMGLGGGRILADPVNFTDVWDPSNVHFGRRGVSSYSYTQNILDNGFISGNNIIKSATLTISFKGGNFLRDWAALSLDGGSSNIFTIGKNSVGFNVNPALLQTDGLLNVTITRLAGNFTFASSTLYVQDDSIGSKSVPEPGTLTLMGAGLIGLAVLSRKRLFRA